MREVFVVSDNIFSPIGSTTGENLVSLKNNISGVKQHSELSMSEQPFYAALFQKEKFPVTGNRYTRFEQMLLASVTDAVKKTDIDLTGKNSILVLSSTKGNISLLETSGRDDGITERISLQHSAKIVARHFNFVNKPIVVSNACISGILAMITAKRLIQSGQYEHAVVAGADTVSKFILSGFQSFQAVSHERCRPFDVARNGINLGEGAATVILSADKKYSTGIKIGGGSVSNDANHISGPSRTGEELCIAIHKTIKEAGVSNKDIDIISAHGTATLYNDEMEAKAINLAGIQSAPVNSLKGFYGHTLGAAGIIESVTAMHSLKEGIVFPTLGFKDIGVSVPVNVSNKMQTGIYKNALKTASGFGGCNAAILIQRE